MPWLEFHDVEQFPAVREGVVPATGVSVHHQTATDSASIICQTACGADHNMAGIVDSRLMVAMDFLVQPSSEGLMMKPLRH
jgi:hypothetical protein